MHNKLSHGFFSNNKVHVQATSLLKRNKHCIETLLGYSYMRNNLVRFGGYPTHRDVADVSYFFYFYFAFIYDQAE